MISDNEQKRILNSERIKQAYVPWAGVITSSLGITPYKPYLMNGKSRKEILVLEVPLILKLRCTLLTNFSSRVPRLEDSG